MKREDVKTQIPGITDDQLNWLMTQNGNDINAEKTKATNLQAELDNVKGQLQTAQDGLKAFDGVDVAELQNKITKLQSDLQAQADGFAFDSALDAAIRDAGGRNVRAIRGMLDVDALKASKNRATDIASAVTKCKTDEGWAFGAAEPTKAGNTMQVTTGAEHGAAGTASDTDGVAAAFAALNPGLKI